MDGNCLDFNSSKISSKKGQKVVFEEFEISVDLARKTGIYYIEDTLGNRANPTLSESLIIKDLINLRLKV